VNDVIYTFVDWPGESFIYDPNDKTVTETAKNFAYDTRRIIQKSRHFVCSLDPDQVVRGLGIGYKEDNYYSEAHLMSRFKEHIGYTPPKYLRSVTFLANKFDLYKKDTNAQELYKMLEGVTESSIYKDNGQWDEENWTTVTEKTTSFLRMKIPGFVTSISTEYAKHNVCFVPAAPYGETVSDKSLDDESDNATGRPTDRKVKKGYMMGLALLHILRSDGVIK
jgi:hypothetical protein